MATGFVTLEELKERLAPLLEQQEDSAVVFDADGTLWSHDVGCMVYDEACEQGIFREEALPWLLAEAKKNGLAIAGTTANDAARSLQKAWYSRRYNERAAAEMQVWAYIGLTEEEFRTLAREALEKGQHDATLHDEVIELAAWVRTQGRRACIVSASPLWVVQEATRELGFARVEIAAGIPNTEARDATVTIRAGLSSPLPYGPDKVVAGRKLLGESAWVAALGDSNFDLHMMAAAQIGVGIGEKESMVSGLVEMSHAVRLRLTL